MSYCSFKVQMQQQNNNLRPVGLVIAIFKFKGPLPRILYPKLTFFEIAIICSGMFLGYIHKNYSGTKTLKKFITSRIHVEIYNNLAVYGVL